MILTAPIPSLASQLADTRRALAARPIEPDHTAASRAKCRETTKAKGKSTQKAVLKAFKKMGAPAGSTAISIITGMSSETVRKHCAELVASGALRINPTRPVTWSLKGTS